MKLFTYLFLFLPIFTIAQENSIDVLKHKLQTYENLLKQEQEKNAYFKEVLDLRSEGVEVSQDKITIRLNTMVGSIEENKIYFQGIVTYNGEERQDIQFQSHELITPDGNQYIAYATGLPNDQNQTFSVREAKAGIPYGFLIQFTDIRKKIPTISLLRLRLYGGIGSGITFDFKGLDVQWD